MNLKEMCAQKGVSLPELAKIIDESQSLIYKIVNGTRKISPRVQKKLDAFFNESTAPLSTGVQNPVEKYKTPFSTQLSEPLIPHEPCPVCGDPNCGLPLEPYQPRDVIRTVHDNNTKLKTITEELEVVMQSMRTLAQLDAMVQQRVDNVVSQHARGIIAVYNHHITAQAALMINTLRNTIVVMREGQISDACVIRILETLIDQLKNLKGYEPPPINMMS